MTDSDQQNGEKRLHPQEKSTKQKKENSVNAKVKICEKEKNQSTKFTNEKIYQNERRKCENFLHKQNPT